MENGAEDRGTWRAAGAGALAGLAGGMALMLAERLEQRVLLPEGSRRGGLGEAAVETVAEEHGATLSAPQAKAAGAAAQLAYCALWGALYGVAHSRIGAPSLVDGLALAAAAYAATMTGPGLLPRLGLESTPMDQSLERTAVPIGAHLAFGVTTAAVYAAAA